MSLILNIVFAQDRIRRFAEVNGINLNKKILKTPLESVEEFLGKRNNYTLKDVMKALRDSEACFWNPDYLTGGPVIIYDKSRLDDDEETIQIIIHEYLHYSPLSINEGEGEVLALMIAVDYQMTFEESIKKMKEQLTLSTLMEVYKPAIALQMYKAIQGTLTIEKVRMWLT